MQFSDLEELWVGIQPFTNLKNLDLGHSYKLKKIPNLLEATNLETLTLVRCTSLVELPSSIRNLHKLKRLSMNYCKELRVIPTNINLASLERVEMQGCSRLRSFPDISSNIKNLNLSGTKIEDVPASIVGSWLCLYTLTIGSRSLKRLTHVPEGVRHLDLSDSDIKRIPDCVIGLPHLDSLTIRNCRKLVSLQSLPPSLWDLDASNCGSLKSVCFSFYDSRVSTFFYIARRVTLHNCLKLDEEARRVIIQRWVYDKVFLPGKEIPAEFTHKATGNSIIISSGTFSASSRFKACLMLSPTVQFRGNIVCRVRSRGVLINELQFYDLKYTRDPHLLPEHLFVFSGGLFKEHRCLEVDATTSEIQFEFSLKGRDDKIMEKTMKCGVQMLAEEEESRSSSKGKEHSDGVSKDESVKSSKHRGWWNWWHRKLSLRKKKTTE